LNDEDQQQQQQQLRQQQANNSLDANENQRLAVTTNNTAVSQAVNSGEGENEEDNEEEEEGDDEKRLKTQSKSTSQTDNNNNNSNSKKPTDFESEERMDKIGDLPSLNNTNNKSILMKKVSANSNDAASLASDDNASLAAQSALKVNSINNSNIPMYYELKVKLKEGKKLAIRDISGNCCQETIILIVAVEFNKFSIKN
jgi:hypothetical protein